MSFRLSPIFYLVSLFISPCHAMLVAGHAVASPDQGRYVAFLGHHHDSDGWGHEARQLDELVAVCKEGISEGKRFHILYERFGDTVNALTPQKSILCDIEETFAEAQVPDCTIENIEIRDCSNAAAQMFEGGGPIEGPDLVWNKNSKPFGEITFQDVFDEFEKYASELEPFTQKLVAEYSELPHICLISLKSSQPREYLNRIKLYLEKNGLSEQTKIYDLAHERKNDCYELGYATSGAFAHLFDMHIFRRLIQLDPEVQPIVITGAWHSDEVEQLLQNLNWGTSIRRGTRIIEKRKPLNYDSIRAIVLNESEWALAAKDTFKYLASIKLALGAQFQTLREAIVSRYCK